MRVYEDSFSGQKIYPGKVRIAAPFPQRRYDEEKEEEEEEEDDDDTHKSMDKNARLIGLRATGQALRSW